MSPAAGGAVAGVDGCRAGWLVLVDDGRVLEAAIEPDFRGVIARTLFCAAVAVDMPIGLLDRPARGGRSVDLAARKLLSGQASSVFPAPPRCVFPCVEYKDEALPLHRRLSDPPGLGFSKQAWYLVPRIKEIDAEMTPELQRRVFEMHPELAFRGLNGGARLQPKKTEEGEQERLGLLGARLARALLRLRGEIPRKDALMDDLIDAAVGVLVARRRAEGKAVRVPPDPEIDARGLAMEMWY